MGAEGQVIEALGRGNQVEGEEGPSTFESRAKDGNRPDRRRHGPEDPADVIVELTTADQTPDQVTEGRIRVLDGLILKKTLEVPLTQKVGKPIAAGEESVAWTDCELTDSAPRPR